MRVSLNPNVALVDRVGRATQVFSQFLWAVGDASSDGARVVLASYTVSTLPGTGTPGQIVFVADGAANKRLAVWDGTSWRFPDGNIVS